MSQTTHVITTLRDAGERITSLRRELLDLLGQSDQPWSVLDIQKQLVKRGFKPNKTTVYRQLAVLVRYQVIHEIRLHDRTKRYEISKDALHHHHHLVCVRCKKIEDVNFKEDLTRQEKIILQTKKFKVLQHSLEFFGVCKNCQKKK